MNQRQHIEAIKAALDRPVVLVGMMGAGKTRIGRMLAGSLDIEFIDTDHVIEAEAGCSIARIFEYSGEQGFRDHETRVIHGLLAPETVVTRILSTGGGAVLRPENAKMIFGNTVSVWLKTDIHVLEERLKGSRNRPLLKNANLMETLDAMAKMRYPLYEQADIILEIDQESPQQVLGNLLACILEKVI